jgi:hypothetical protein
VKFGGGHVYPIVVKELGLALIKKGLSSKPMLGKIS